MSEFFLKPIDSRIKRIKIKWKDIEFQSISDAARYFKRSDSMIHTYLKKQKKFNGYYFYKVEKVDD